ncbi:hypothetical protein DP092_13100 [Pseudomonas sp. MDMC224]|jgi:NhaB family Na+:H+ antiporter|uniref:Na+:H+ antiporter, NhaB family n=1 Tax=Ectopseudomonas toyotomiensis TaxID=554344 RepID=A0A1I5U834_9GAMM|nr:hypothetical protein [Pseudomonas sp.]PIA67503.1 hypothetical protein CDR19_22905 [Pseudomonas toyotomiensis]PKM28480.1 MAG: hypothetical protein CVV07_14060 [Gammaproteobacteria bacterium HGW-Gammaproteobacteria-11]RAR35370.1 hypothetical protein DP092_13100 [Pseudomonas sp. MDMC224]MPT21331.1 hypothetical protein [Pseudomonas sp.]
MPPTTTAAFAHNALDHAPTWHKQLTVEFIFTLINGVLLTISDNVFVATVYISEIKQVLGVGTIDRDFERLAINTGTYLPSVATANGPAALLLLLTSANASPARLHYRRMAVMALPYTLAMGGVGLLSVIFLV